MRRCDRQQKKNVILRDTSLRCNDTSTVCFVFLARTDPLHSQWHELAQERHLDMFFFFFMSDGSISCRRHNITSYSRSRPHCILSGTSLRREHHLDILFLALFSCLMRVSQRHNSISHSRNRPTRLHFAFLFQDKNVSSKQILENSAPDALNNNSATNHLSYGRNSPLQLKWHAACTGNS